MLVVDASALLLLLLNQPGAGLVGASIAAEPGCAPDLIDAEVFHRLVTLGKRSHATADEVRARVGLLHAAPLVRVPTRDLLDAALPLAAALSGYDAVYAALARRVSGTLLTADRRLARTASDQFGIPVRMVTSQL